MAKVLNTQTGAESEQPKTPDPSAPTTQEAQDALPQTEKAAHVAELEEQLDVKTVADPKAVKIGDKVALLNTTKWTIQCPYSKARFPADNLSGKVEVNQWIKAQITAGILRVPV